MYFINIFYQEAMFLIQIVPYCGNLSNVFGANFFNTNYPILR